MGLAKALRSLMGFGIVFRIYATPLLPIHLLSVASVMFVLSVLKVGMHPLLFGGISVCSNCLQSLDPASGR
jgi:hypothetical protein